MSALEPGFHSILLQFLGEQNEVVNSLSQPLESIQVEGNGVLGSLLLALIHVIPKIELLLRMD